MILFQLFVIIEKWSVVSYMALSLWFLLALCLLSCYRYSCQQPSSTYSCVKQQPSKRAWLFQNAVFYFSSPFDTISAMNLLWKLYAPDYHTAIGYCTSKQTDPRQFGLASHLLYFSVQRLCDQPPPPPLRSCYTVYDSQTLRELVKYTDNTTIISCITNNDETSYQEENNNLVLFNVKEMGTWI